MSKSNIEWTDETWNPTVGCNKISPGCKHCYAEVMHARLTAMGIEKYSQPFNKPRPWREHLETPLRWRKPRFVFVNSMSDLFHKAMPLEYIQEVFDVMRRCPQHTFQVLTKRSDRLVELADELPWPKNVWMGVSVESQEYAFRSSDLQKVPAHTRFLSVEPLIGPVDDLPLEGIHWVIVGGESGRKARPMELDWARSVRDQCVKANVLFFLKQLGGRRSKRGGDKAILDGERWTQRPPLGSSKLLAVR